MRARVIFQEILPKVLNKYNKIHFLTLKINLIVKKNNNVWGLTSNVSLAEIWEHPEEEVYNELLENSVGCMLCKKLQL